VVSGTRVLLLRAVAALICSLPFGRVFRFGYYELSISFAGLYYACNRESRAAIIGFRRCGELRRLRPASMRLRTRKRHGGLGNDAES
jgi:hypothetical protein